MRASGRLVLAAESGVALIMAIGILLVLMIALTTVIFLSSGSAQHARSSNGGQQAYALAEAGISDAMGQISSHYPSVTGGSSAWLTHTAPAANADGSTSDWSGSFDSATNKWSLTGTGTVRNPTGGSTIVRTATANADVTPGMPLALQYPYFMQDPTAPCTTIANSGAASVSIYVASCLSITGSARVVEPASPGNTLDVYVGGVLSTANSGTTIGGAGALSSPWPIRSATTPGGCSYSGGAVTTCGPATRVWATTYSTATVAPGTSWHADAATIYAMANWSTTGSHPVTCATGSDPFDSNSLRDSSLGTYRPLNGASFDCTATDSFGNFVGSLKWDSAAFLLTIAGTVFIDASKLSFQGIDKALYSGSGTVYANGTVNFANSGSICGPGPGAAAVADCPGEHWVPAQGELLLWALNSANLTPAVSVGGASFLEGGAVADSQDATPAKLAVLNGAVIRGPAIGDYGALDGDGKAKPFVFVPSGAPGGGFTLGSTYNSAGG